MRRLALLLTGAALLAPPAVASGAAVLRAVGTAPLTVRGARFLPSERVTVRVLVPGPVRVHVIRASAGGTFTTTFTAVSLRRCARYVILARGSKGSSATLRRIFPACSPL
ncbi:MAG: hypothetical protein ACM3QU_04565 [Verrucomicrobiota bacterium]